MSNFYQLRKEAWKHFQRTADEKVKVALYNVLQSINDVILGAVAVSDIIEAELLDRSKQQAETLREDMSQAIESEAIF